MPGLEALTRLGQGPGSERILEMLNRLAPTWLAQMSSLVSEAERVRLQRAAEGATQRRMLREARIIARLEHPGIVPLHDFGHLADGLFQPLQKLIDVFEFGIAREQAFQLGNALSPDLQYYRLQYLNTFSPSN